MRATNLGHINIRKLVRRTENREKKVKSNLLSGVYKNIFYFYF